MKSKSEPLRLVSPIGRLVQGSLYDPITTDLDNNPLKYKSGKKAGQDASRYYFAVAIKKGKEKHWKETEWGKKIWAFAEENAQAGVISKPDFAWKIEDGDCAEPNHNNRRNCDLEGFPGSWVIRLSTYIAPQIVNEKANPLVQKDFIRPGYFIQVYFSVAYNNPMHKSTVKNGLFLNPEIVSFRAYGEEIAQYSRPNPKDIEFGGKLPEGASATPVSLDFSGSDEEEESPEPPAPPAPPSASRKVELGGHTWELSAMLKKGWTESSLESAGYTFL